MIYYYLQAHVRCFVLLLLCITFTLVYYCYFGELQLLWCITYYCITVTLVYYSFFGVLLIIVLMLLWITVTLYYCYFGVLQLLSINLILLASAIVCKEIRRKCHSFVALNLIRISPASWIRKQIDLM